MKGYRQFGKERQGRVNPGRKAPSVVGGGCGRREGASGPRAQRRLGAGCRARGPEAALGPWVGEEVWGPASPSRVAAAQSVLAADKQ